MIIARFGQSHNVLVGLWDPVPVETGNNLPRVDLGTGRTATDLGGGGINPCAVLDNGSLFCLPNTGWKGDYDRLGDARDPTPLGTGRTAVATDYGWVLLDDGTLKVLWGSNHSGHRGIGSTGRVSSWEIDGTEPAADLGTPPTSAVLPSLTSGTSYLVRVSAVNEFGVGLPSPAQEVIAP